MPAVYLSTIRKHEYSELEHPLEMENVGTGQGLQLLVPVPDGLSTHATVELQLLDALQELHHLLCELLLLPPASINPLAQAVNLQCTQLQTHTQEKKGQRPTHCDIKNRSESFVKVVIKDESVPCFPFHRLIPVLAAKNLEPATKSKSRMTAYSKY